MKQYAYEMTSKRTGGAHRVYVTAARPEWAYLQVLAAYADEFDVCDLFCDVGRPHQVCGEIDASGMTQTDADWLQSKLS